jgi:hypothetical protein
MQNGTQADTTVSAVFGTRTANTRSPHGSQAGHQSRSKHSKINNTVK